MLRCIRRWATSKYVALLTQIEVFCETVPRAAENFLAHCAAGTYDQVLWHRNMAGFMVQTGDPTGTGKGGESIWGRAFDDEIRPTLKVRCATYSVPCAGYGRDGHRQAERQWLSGAYHALTQFFITYSEQPHLNGKYTIFGKVIEGAELGGTLEAIEKVPVDAKYRPVHEIRTQSVTIHANPIAQKAITGEVTR